VVCGVLLYVFAAAWKVFAVLVVPWLIELHDVSPRLAALGWLGLFTSPAIFVGLVHRTTHGLVDLFDASARAPGTTRAAPALESAWAGLLGWFTMSFAAMISAMIALVLFPESAGGAMGAASQLVQLAEDVPLRANVHSAIWVATAAGIYYLERVTRGPAPSA
jgi:hypothetical protein